MHNHSSLAVNHALLFKIVIFLLVVSLASKLNLAAQVGSFYEEKAGELLAEQNPQGAIEVWKGAIKQDPNNATAYSKIGLIYFFHLQQSNEAKQWLNKAVKLNPRNGEYYSYLGAVYIDGKNCEAAIIHFEKGITLGFKHELTYSSLAACYYHLGQHVQSEKYLSEAMKVAQKPRTALRMFEETKQYLQQTQSTKKTDVLQQSQPTQKTDVPEEKSSDPKFYHDKGLQSYNEGNYEKAIEMWLKEIELNPKSGWAYYDIGLAYERIRKPQEAIPWRKKAIELQPSNGRFYAGAGQSLAYNNDCPNAIAYLNKAISLGDKTEWTYGWLSECRYLMGEYDKAESSLIEAFKVNPDYEWGISKVKEGRFPHITEDTVKRIKEEKIRKREERMKQLQKEGRLKEIEIPADVLLFMYFPYFVFGVLLIAGLIALRTKPWWRYHVYAGNKYFSRTDYPRALKHYEKLLNFKGGKFAPYEKLKTIYLTMRRTDPKAVLVYEKLYEENPEDHEVVLALAEIYAQK